MMSGRKRRPNWLPDEDRAVDRYLAQGQTLREISDLLTNRPIDSIAARLRKRFSSDEVDAKLADRRGHHWTPPQDAELKRCYEAGYSQSLIAILLGRGTGSINHRVGMVITGSFSNEFGNINVVPPKSVSADSPMVTPESSAAHVPGTKVPKTVVLPRTTVPRAMTVDFIESMLAGVLMLKEEIEGYLTSLAMAELRD